MSAPEREDGLTSTLERAAEPASTAPVRATRGARSAGVVTGLLVLLLGVAVAGAAPALAIDDPTRPDYRVTHGPSCRPGGIVVEVVAGTAAYTVRLSTTRQPAGEDEAVLAPLGSVVLRTGDVAPGETIDPRLEFATRDGSGATYVDELEDYTLTRPTVEDCEVALNPPPAPPVVPAVTVGPAAPSAAPPSGTATGRTTTGSRPTGPATSTVPAGTSAPATTTSGSASPAPQPAGLSPAGRLSAGAAAGLVQVGGTVVLHGAGFLPGERVDILLHGSDVLLATATADTDGAVRVDVRIPVEATTGPVTLDMVGADSAVITGVDLQVAAGQQEVPPARGVLSLASLVAAAVALVATVAGLVSVAGQQHAGRHERRPVPSR
ncbi:hypothetical protein [Blastococcus montanus]|uniref:hypothetical protein n=1 Tax=Blastococcus montanus TaxID=3144973 RepID=UPI00320B701F